MRSKLVGHETRMYSPSGLWSGKLLFSFTTAWLVLGRYCDTTSQQLPQPTRLAWNTWVDVCFALSAVFATKTWGVQHRIQEPAFGRGSLHGTLQLVPVSFCPLFRVCPSSVVSAHDAVRTTTTSAYLARVRDLREGPTEEKGCLDELSLRERLGCSVGL